MECLNELSKELCLYALSGLFIGFSFLVSCLVYLINKHHSDFLYYLLHKQEFKESKTEIHKLFNNYIKSNKENLEPFYENSKENQKKLLPVIVNSNIERNIASKILDISNREMDKYKIVSLLNNFALNEFEANRFDRKTQKIINKLFHSFELIINNNKDDYIEASGLLIECYEKFVNNSEEIKLETLRYLTFCYFAVNDNKNVLYWLNIAKELKNNHTITRANYVANYFWVDLLDLLISIKKNDTISANSAFISLNKNADPEFVELKLLQHELRLSGEDLILWKKYL